MINTLMMRFTYLLQQYLGVYISKLIISFIYVNITWLAKGFELWKTSFVKFCIHFIGKGC
jgi:hypothetical protein